MNFLNCLTLYNRGQQVGDSLDRVVRNSDEFGRDDVAGGDGGEDCGEGELTEIQMAFVFNSFETFLKFFNVNFFSRINLKLHF